VKPFETRAQQAWKRIDAALDQWNLKHSRAKVPHRGKGTEYVSSGGENRGHDDSVPDKIQAGRNG
jgi:hypothetical protein